jgi:hypothetical protein
MANDFIVKPLFAAASGFIPDLIHVGSVAALLAPTGISAAK